MMPTLNNAYTILSDAHIQDAHRDYDAVEPKNGFCFVSKSLGKLVIYPIMASPILWGRYYRDTLSMKLRAIFEHDYPKT